MSSVREQRPHVNDDRLRGFSLRDVSWGYRDLFARTIDGLFQQGLLGPEREATSRQFFELLKQADQSCFDHVLKEFISAINPRTRWIMDLPGVFAEVVTLGRELAEERLHYGITFFRIWGEGGLGETPREVRGAISRILRLRQVDDALALAFLRGYGKLRTRLQGDEIDRFLQEGLRLYGRNPRHAVSFMEGATKSAETMIGSITRECRLDDVARELTALVRALTGRRVEIDHLGRLDSDDLIERGTSVVCMYKWLYVPAVIRHFDERRRNRAWYLLTAVMAAGLLAEESFPRIHGHPDYRTCVDLVGPDCARVNLFQIVEYVRVVERIRECWPGAQDLVRFGLRTEFAERPSVNAAEPLLRDCLAPGGNETPAVRIVRDVARQSVNVFDTAYRLDEATVRRVTTSCAGIGDGYLHPLGFLPDFLFPGQVSAPPQGQVIADLHDAADRQRHKAGERPDADEAKATVFAAETAGEEEPGDTDAAAVQACFSYDEWCQAENDYYTDHCLVHERPGEVRAHPARPEGIGEEVRRVRQTFERLKPDLARKEKRLREGDEINSDRLVDYLVKRQKEPAPRVDFYERPLTRRRDLAVLVLLDVSGSTGGTEGDQAVIDIEKRTALIFAEGLSALGDAFAVCGFSGSGRENCEYIIYKDFEAPWSEPSVKALLSATPASSTRIGPALRHSGYKLSQRGNRRRLILLVTDGKPMDSGYDPNTRYAQYDVRKACEENLRRGVRTFAISTEENTRADMEIMFPHQRFVILPGMRRLPDILPKLYLRITT